MKMVELCIPWWLENAVKESQCSPAGSLLSTALGLEPEVGPLVGRCLFRGIGGRLDNLTSPTRARFFVGSLQTHFFVGSLQILYSIPYEEPIQK